MTAAGRDRFERRLEELAEAIRDSGARMLVCTQSMVLHRDGARDEIARISRNPTRQRELVETGEQLAELLARFAERHRAPLVDAYRGIAPTRSHLVDAIHLTAAGERRLAGLPARRARRDAAGCGHDGPAIEEWRQAR
ncbi:MAG: SGNH/GDSL hydrolase family protein [Planctomycetaceae bacterium]